MMYDHGMPPGPKQSPNADINIEYQKNSKMAAESAKLASALETSNRIYAKTYPVTIGDNMYVSPTSQYPIFRTLTIPEV